jgi:hypothetical protein
MRAPAVQPCGHELLEQRDIFSARFACLPGRYDTGGKFTGRIGRPVFELRLGFALNSVARLAS